MTVSRNTQINTLIMRGMSASEAEASVDGRLTGMHYTDSALPHRLQDCAPDRCGAATVYVCDRCGRPAHPAAPDADPDAARWYHDHIADDVFCGLVMHAADRAAGR